jgi:hypothetical protein
MPATNDRLRSFAVLGGAFGGVVAVTVGLSWLLTTGPTGSTPESGSASATAEPGGIPGLGGALAVSGDRQGTFHLTRGTGGDPYALVGDQGRITFEGRPPVISQISYEGLEFFPEPDDCPLTPSNNANRIGIGFAELRCENLSDIRGNGTITLSGEVGLPLDMVAETNLPESGGSLTVGDETWEFAEATLIGYQRPAIAGRTEYNMELEDEDRDASVNFTYDYVSHRLTLASLVRGGEENDVPADRCELLVADVGRPNPRTTVIELTISCVDVEVPGLGRVSISGTVIVDRVEFPD